MTQPDLAVMPEPSGDHLPPPSPPPACFSFMRSIEREHGVRLPDYAALYDWSIREPSDSGAPCGHLRGARRAAGRHRGRALRKDAGARWFPQARLNFAANLLRRNDNQCAIAFWGEDR